MCVCPASMLSRMLILPAQTMFKNRCTHDMGAARASISDRGRIIEGRTQTGFEFCTHHQPSRGTLFSFMMLFNGGNWDHGIHGAAEGIQEQPW